MSVSDLTSSVIKGVSRLPRKVFGSRNERLLKVYQRQVGPINAFEPGLRGNFDERFTRRCAEQGIADLPEEERGPAVQRIRVELSEDLRARTESLRKRCWEHHEPLERWWRTLSPAQHLEHYYHDEYRKRNAKIIDALDRSGVNQEGFAILREAPRRAQNHRH